MFTEVLFENFIEKQVGKVAIGVISKEYAKAYCFGYLNAKHEDGFITDNEYDNISRTIDDRFN